MTDMPHKKSSVRSSAPASSKTSAKKASDLSRLIGLRSFLRDKIFYLIFAFTTWLILILFFSAFHLQLEIIVFVSTIWWFFCICNLSYEYCRRRRFYRALTVNLSQLQQAYLILETLDEPSFYDGKIFYETLLRTNKSMSENINSYATQSQEFREYVEMWIHEVKTPLATLSLLTHDPKIHKQIKRLDDYVEQILYFVRAENAERDYLIKDVNLEKIVGAVASRNREILLASQIDFSVSNLNHTVQTDAKWLEFIINQILANSIKYRSTAISISAHETKDKTTLTVHDNGIGISEKDLPRVFDKSFTGSNGHSGKQSTGMGLYIAKTLCQKLGHQIQIRSEVGKYTDVEIVFAKNNYYKNVI